MKPIKKKRLKIKKDERGVLIEVIKPDYVDASLQGQVFLTTAYPGKTKGNHYHLRKTEWYCVIKGVGMLTLVDIKTKEKKQKKMSDKTMELIEIPPQTFHSITNIGKEDMSLLVYVNEIFDEKDSDTFYEIP